jgi:hypothetical protein
MNSAQQLVKTLRKIQEDKKTLTLYELVERYKPFAKLYSPLFDKVVKEDFTEEDYGRIMSMMALRHQVNHKILSLNEADEKIKEKLFHRFFREDENSN